MVAEDLKLNNHADLEVGQAQVEKPPKNNN